MMRAALVAVLVFSFFNQGVARQDETRKPKTAAITDAQKRDFLELLQNLPHEGEFYTEGAINKAEPYLPVLLSLNQHDLEGRDIYPFAAISRGLCDRRQSRDYVVAHFYDIQHPQLRLFWAAIIFKENAASPEIKVFLREALRSEQQSQELREIVGPSFDDFKKRVLDSAPQKG